MIARHRVSAGPGSAARVPVATGAGLGGAYFWRALYPALSRRATLNGPSGAKRNEAQSIRGTSLFPPSLLFPLPNFPRIFLKRKKTEENPRPTFASRAANSDKFVPQGAVSVQPP